MTSLWLCKGRRRSFGSTRSHLEYSSLILPSSLSLLEESCEVVSTKVSYRPTRRARDIAATEEDSESFLSYDERMYQEERKDVMNDASTIVADSAHPYEDANLADNQEDTMQQRIPSPTTAMIPFQEQGVLARMLQQQELEFGTLKSKHHRKKRGKKKTLPRSSHSSSLLLCPARQFHRTVAAAKRHHKKTKLDFSKKLAKLKTESLCSVRETTELLMDDNSFPLLGSSYKQQADAISDSASSTSQTLLQKIAKLAEKAQIDRQTHQQELSELNEKLQDYQRKFDNVTQELQAAKANEQRLGQELDRLKQSLLVAPTKEEQRRWKKATKKILHQDDEIDGGKKNHDKIRGFLRSLVPSKKKKKRRAERRMTEECSFC